MKQQLTVQEVRNGATFTSYFALVILVGYLYSMSIWFHAFYESPLAMIGFLVSLLAVLWNGKVTGVAGFAERIEKAGLSLEKK